MRLLTLQRALSSMTPARLRDLCKRSVFAWIDDYAPSMGAAIAYYTLFSLAPVLIVAIAIAGMLFGEEAARGEIVAQLGGLIGQEGATAVQGLIESASKPGRSVTASALGLATLFLGATTVFAELQSALDRIWRVPAAPQTSGFGLISLLRTRIMSFGMVVSLGFLLLVSLIVSAALAAFGKWWGGFFPGWELLLQALNTVLSFALTTVLFAMIYRVLPRARVTWYDVWVGAVVTSVLFTLGKLAIGLYLGKAGITSGFGAAGSIVVLLLWVYYSAQIFLLGAEFTWVFAHSDGSRAHEPHPAAAKIPARSRTEPAPADA